MNKNEALKLVEKLSNDRQGVTEFVAPSIKSKFIWIATKSGNIRLIAPENVEGWYRFKRDGEHASVVADATEIEKIDYKSVLRKRKAIVGPILDPSAPSARLCVIVNTDAPVLVNLCDDVELFDTISILDGQAYIYDETIFDDNYNKERLLTELSKKSKVLTKWPTQTQAHRAAYGLVVASLKNSPGWFSEEDQLRNNATEAGATIEYLRQTRNGWIVTFVTDNKKRTTTEINNKGMVESAGFCLSGEDNKFSFRSLISLLENR